MTPHQNEQSLYPPAVSLIFEARNGPWTSKSYLKRYLASNGLGWNQRKLTVNNGQASGFRGKIMLKRVRLNKLPYTVNGYHLVNDHNDVRLYMVKQFPGVPNLRRSTPFYIFMHFLPGISLLTLWRFVAEVRWLFPESRQKKRESGKQRNTEPWR